MEAACLGNGKWQVGEVVETVDHEFVDSPETADRRWPFAKQAQPANGAAVEQSFWCCHELVLGRLPATAPS
jgi:hypothetical protein